MAGRAFRRVRTAGQQIPLTVELVDFLQWGLSLLSGGGHEIPRALAEVAWRRHRIEVLAAWELHWQSDGIVPTTWAARVFDREPQIDLPGDPAVRNLIASIERNVD